MSTIGQEHFYYVDPGIGKRRSGCPYSFYKDGRDIVRYIRPPRGYELVDFKFVPYKSDDFYDGKIVAQYKKLPFFIRLFKDPVLFLVTFLGIFGVVAGLVYYFQNSQPDPSPEMLPLRNFKTETDILPVDTTAQAQVDTSLSIVDTSMIVIDTAMITDTSMITEGILDTVPETEEIAVKEVVEEEIKEKTEIVKEETAPIEEVVKPKENEVAPKPELKSEPTQEAQPTEVLTKEQFKREFWDLIHHKETKMRTYSNLYRKYKDQNFKNKEFFYLYLTILENSYAFDAWKNNLLNIPDDELRSIRTINALTEKLEEYE